MNDTDLIVRFKDIETHVYMIRGQRVMLDRELAVLYGVPTKAFNQAVRRHRNRFPTDFMFQLTRQEARDWWQEVNAARLRSQNVTLKRGEHLKYAPYAFTEHGILMLSSVLKSNRAIYVNIAIMRTFVKLRAMVVDNAVLSRKLDVLEQKYDRQFKIVFDAIRQLMSPPSGKSKVIGFRASARKK